MTFAEKAINFFTNLYTPAILPVNISIMNPYEKDEVNGVINRFYKKYFNNNNKRIFIWGINPGRFGGGLTGIAFTDPVALKEYCSIDNNLGTKRELSSKYIYEMITAFGGVSEFYSRCFLTALYPLALIKNDKNYNYYDEPQLYEALKSDIISSFKQQSCFGADPKLAVCLGKKNYIYLKQINDEVKFFERIEVVEHPRYIMQYKNKTMKVYIEKYLSVLKN